MNLIYLLDMTLEVESRRVINHSVRCTQIQGEVNLSLGVQQTCSDESLIVMNQSTPDQTYRTLVSAMRREP